MNNDLVESQSNQLNILKSLHRFGWLTTRMIAALIWPTRSQALALARRNLNQLVSNKLAMKRELPSSGDCYLLTAKGARLITPELGHPACSGQTLSLGNPIHRACSNWLLIHKIVSGFTVWTEHEIATGRAPIKEVLGKIPDGLVATENGLIWVEVENAWKNRARRESIAKFCERLLPREQSLSLLTTSDYIFRVLIVATNSEALDAIGRTLKESYELGFISEAQLHEIEISVLPISKELSMESLHLGQGWYDLVAPMLNDSN